MNNEDRKLVTFMRKHIGEVLSEHGPYLNDLDTSNASAGEYWFSNLAVYGFIARYEYAARQLEMLNGALMMVSDSTLEEMQAQLEMLVEKFRSYLYDAIVSERKSSED